MWGILLIAFIVSSCDGKAILSDNSESLKRLPVEDDVVVAETPSEPELETETVASEESPLPEIPPPTPDEAPPPLALAPEEQIVPPPPEIPSPEPPPAPESPVAIPEETQINNTPLHVSLGEESYYSLEKTQPVRLFITNLAEHPNLSKVDFFVDEGCTQTLPNTQINDAEYEVIVNTGSVQLYAGLHYINGELTSFSCRASIAFTVNSPESRCAALAPDNEELLGAGTEADPYIICSNLQKIEDNIAAYYLIGSDIDLGESWVPLANNGGFTGVLDGRMHVISNLSIDKDESYQGLFAQIGSEDAEGKIMNLVLSGNPCDPKCDLQVDSYGGSVAGEVVFGYFRNITSGVSVKGSGNYIGGLFGLISGSIDGEYLEYSGEVQGLDDVGGLAGAVLGEARFNAVRNTGAISGEKQVAGLIGSYSGSNLYLSNALNSGKVIGSLAAGILGAASGAFKVSGVSNEGVVVAFDTGGGFMATYTGKGGLIEQGQNSGSINSGNILGGLVGHLLAGAKLDINSIANRGDVVGSDTAGGLAGKVGEANEGAELNSENLENSAVIIGYDSGEIFGMVVNSVLNLNAVNVIGEANGGNTDSGLNVLSSVSVRLAVPGFTWPWTENPAFPWNSAPLPAP